MIKYDFAVFTLGCKVNAYEGRSMASKLAASGFSVTEGLEFADNYIINTCSVTQEADKKSRQTVARMLKINPKARVYICGCSSQNDAVKFSDKSNVRIVSGVGGKAELVDEILADLEGQAGDRISLKPLPDSYEAVSSPEITRTRGFIKVQDGCDNFCSYCIIPYLRGRARSNDIQKIVLEAQEAAQNTKELVFSGINLSSFGKDTGVSLLELVKALNKIPVRKRFGSLECHIITDEFVRIAIDSGFCDHFHLSMQSGSDTVLKRMNRHYTSAQFLEKIEIIRKICPDAGITTDVIAGFCGESESEHLETVRTMQTAAFSDAHIFVYSERKGTKAYGLEQVDKNIRAARAAELSAVKDASRKMFLQNNIGKANKVYFEDISDDGLCGGYTSNFIKAYADSQDGILADVMIESIYKDGVKCKIV